MEELGLNDCFQGIPNTNRSTSIGFRGDLCFRRPLRPEAPIGDYSGLFVAYWGLLILGGAQSEWEVETSVCHATWKSRPFTTHSMNPAVKQKKVRPIYLGELQLH